MADVLIALDEKDRNDGIVGTSGCSLTCHDANLIVIGGWNPEYVDDLLTPTRDADTNYVRKIYKYNMYSDLWTSLPCFIDERTCPVETASHCAFSLSHDSVLFLGGSFSCVGRVESSNALYIYSLKTKSWEAVNCSPEDLPPTDVGHWFGRAAFLDNSILTVATGDQVRFRMTIHQLDISKPQLKWEAITAVAGGIELSPEPFIKHQIVVYDQKVFVFGGSVEFGGRILGDENSPSFASIPTFDLVQRKWTRTNCTGPEEFLSMWPFAASTVLIGGFVFLTGGTVWQANIRKWKLLTDVLRLDLREHQWNVFAKLPGGGRYFHASGVSPDGRLCVFGGCPTKSYFTGRRSDFAFVQCAVPSLMHVALRALFAESRGRRLADRIRRDENRDAAIAALQADGIPAFVTRWLL